MALGIIPKTSWLDSVDRYAGSLAIGIFMAVGGAIASFGGGATTTAVGGATTGVALVAGIPWLAIGGLVLGLAVTAWGISSHYKSRRLSVPVSIKRSEELTIANAKIQARENAKEMGAVLTKHFEHKKPEPGDVDNQIYRAESVPPLHHHGHRQRIHFEPPEDQAQQWQRHEGERQHMRDRGDSGRHSGELRRPKQHYSRRFPPDYDWESRAARPPAGVNAGSMGVEI